MDHFQVISTDTYIARPTPTSPGGASCRRSQTVALIPAQGGSPNYTVEAKLERLMESDYNDFVPVAGDVVPPMSTLQGLVDERRIAVTRTFQVIAKYHDGTRNRSVIKSTEPKSIISPLTSFFSSLSKVNLPPSYALSPAIALATSLEAEKVTFEEILAEMNQALNANEGGGGGNMGVAQTDEHGNGVIVNNTVVAGGGNAGGGVYVMGGDNKTAQKDKNAKNKKGEADGNKNSGWQI